MVILIFISALLFWPVYTSQDTFLGKLATLSLNSGSFSFAILMDMFLGRSNVTNVISIFSHSIITLLLFYFAFKQSRVKILYIIIFIINLLFSDILAVYVLSGLY